MQRRSYNAAVPATSSNQQLHALTHTQLVEMVSSLQHRLAWFERQLFGTKSERLRVLEQDARQLALGEMLINGAPSSPVQKRTVAAHTRRVKQSDAAAVGEAESVPFFDRSRVPVETIRLDAPERDGIPAEQLQVIGQKVTYRLAQRPGSYVVLEYVREIVKRRDTQQISCAPAPQGAIEGSRADVSFLAGLLIDKFAWHLPLYRQHQRLLDSGLNVTRPWLTQLVQQGVSLLDPIYQAQLDSIRASRVICMDETPIKAGRAGHGKMKTAYFWPLYGELDEVCFPFFPSRAHEHVRTVLGPTRALGSVLLSDGYAAYESYAKKLDLTHAQCWSHCRRELFEAEPIEPDRVREALQRIAAIYAVEEDIRQHTLTGEAKQLHRLTHSKPLVEAFFEWVERQLQDQALLPSSPFTKALGYAHHRRAALQVFLTDPDVPVDTNHLERALRVVPMGRRNWLFCWTELGAEHVGIMQSLIVTCRLHGINPYDYLVDVLQRVGEHPASRVAELTPRLWKQRFAANPLRSALHTLAA